MPKEELTEGFICPQRMVCQSLTCHHASIHKHENLCDDNCMNYSGKKKCIEYTEDNDFGERLGIFNDFERFRGR